MMIEIQCLCGAVAVELKGEPLAQFYCHCDDCQLVHGAAYVPVAVYPAAAVKITRGTAGGFRLKSTPRRTCQQCGARLFAEPNEHIRGVTAYLLPKQHFKPAFHVNCGFALLPVRDALPHYKLLPSRFGGSDEMVEW